MLTAIVELYRPESLRDPESAKVIEEWQNERSQYREEAKALFNPQFGSLFRTYHNMTHFSKRLHRLSDVYTSRVPNLLNYDIRHCFFPRRNALPHESLHSVPINSDSILDILKRKEQLRGDAERA